MGVIFRPLSLTSWLGWDKHPPYWGKTGMILWRGLKNTGKQAGDKIRGKTKSENAPPHPQAPWPLTHQDAAPMEVPISLEILGFIPNERCGPYRCVSPLIADGDRDRGWG